MVSAGIMGSKVDTRDRVGSGAEIVQGVKDRRVQSLRIEGGMRAIAWHDGRLGVLLYVDQHEPAYKWATSWKVNVTTLADGVTVVVTLDADLDGDYRRQWQGQRSPSADEEPGLFNVLSTSELREAGVPDALIPVVRGICDDAAFEELEPALDADLYDRLLALCLGMDEADTTRKAKAEAASAASIPERSLELETVVEPAGALDSAHAQAELPPGSAEALPLRDVDPDDFQRMLENSTEWWVAFADPVQRKIAGSSFSGAVLVTGGAGTGKTIVAMHRARHLARKGKRVLITSYNVALCEAIRRDITLLCDEAELEHITGAAAVFGRPASPGHGQERAVRAPDQAGDRAPLEEGEQEPLRRGDRGRDSGRRRLAPCPDTPARGQGARQPDAARRHEPAHLRRAARP